MQWLKVLLGPRVAREMVETASVGFLPVLFAGNDMEAVPGDQHGERSSLVLQTVIDGGKPRASELYLYSSGYEHFPALYQVINDSAMEYV